VRPRRGLQMEQVGETRKRGLSGAVIGHPRSYFEVGPFRVSKGLKLESLPPDYLRPSNFLEISIRGGETSGACASWFCGSLSTELHFPDLFEWQKKSLRVLVVYIRLANRADLAFMA
jgi:hypothetical protein